MKRAPLQILPVRLLATGAAQAPALLIAYAALAGCGSRTPLDVTLGAGPGSATDGGGGASSTGSAPTAGTSTASATSVRVSTATSVASSNLGSRFPAGTYAKCAEGLHTADGNVFLNTSGFEASGGLTVEATGETLAVTFVDQDGHSTDLAFTSVAPTAATLGAPVALSGSFTGLCVAGPGDEGASPATFEATSGTLLYDGGSAFAFLSGTVSAANVGVVPCGSMSVPATFWLACGTTGAPPSLSLRDAGAAPVFDLGEYVCVSQVAAYEHIGMIDHYATAGSGDIAPEPTLILDQSGAQVAATYRGDEAVAEALGFDVLTSTSAVARAGQRATAPCQVSTAGEMAIPPPTPEPVALRSGALARVGDTVFLSVLGEEQPAAGSVCAGESFAATLICTKP